MRKIYYYQNNEVQGPIEQDLLASLITSKMLPGETLCCDVGSETWWPASSRFSPPPLPPPLPIQASPSYRSKDYWNAGNITAVFFIFLIWIGMAFVFFGKKTTPAATPAPVADVRTASSTAERIGRSLGAAHKQGGHALPDNAALKQLSIYHARENRAANETAWAAEFRIAFRNGYMGW